MAGENLTIGQDFAGYLIESVAGEGGMGIVYRAVQRALGRTVALKVIRPDVALTREYRWRFMREAMLASAVDHPNIVSVFDVGDYEDVLYLAMQWVDGVDLRSVMARESRLEPGRAVRIGLQLAGALQALTEAGLVHRDLKPSNVLVRDLSGQDHIYLTDFGVAKMPGTDDGLTRAGWQAGTSRYMAPEQIRGEPADSRSDLYALGCVLFEALTGQRPFSGGNDLAVRWANASGPRPVASASCPELGEGYDAFFTRALAIAPEDRFASGAEFAAALESAHTAEPGEATRTWAAHGTPTLLRTGTEAAVTLPPPGAQPPADAAESYQDAATELAPPRRPARKFRPGPAIAIAGAVVVACGLAAAIVAVTRPHGSATAGTPSAAKPIDVRSPTATIAITHSGTTAYLTSFHGDVVIPVSLASGAAGAPITVGQDPFAIAITSDDKTAYVACTRSNAVYPIDLATGTAGTPIPVGSEPFAIAITANDETAYVANSGSRSVSAINLASDTVAATIPVGGSPQSIAIAPDQHTVYVGNFDDDTVTPISVGTDTAGQPIPVGAGPAAIAITPDGGTGYVANFVASTVTPIDLATDTTRAAIRVGAGPFAIAISASGSAAYVADVNSNTVTPINLATGKPGRGIPAGGHPHGIAIGGGTAYVADSTDDNVTTIKNTG